MVIWHPLCHHCTLQSFQLKCHKMNYSSGIIDEIQKSYYLQKTVAVQGQYIRPSFSVYEKILDLIKLLIDILVLISEYTFHNTLPTFVQNFSQNEVHKYLIQISYKLPVEPEPPMYLRGISLTRNQEATPIFIKYMYDIVL